MFKYARELGDLIKEGELTREILGRSQLAQAGTIKYLELIGEEAWQLRKAGVDLDGIPLRQIANMRHRMVHAYEGIDWSIVEEAAFEDVPDLVSALEEVAKGLSIDLSVADGGEFDVQ